MKKYRCKVCKAEFELPEGTEVICPVCHVSGDKLEVIAESPKTKYAGTQTEKNLEAAFAGESQARNKYTYFASVAKKEGYEQIAALFLKTADNEKAYNPYQHAPPLDKIPYPLLQVQIPTDLNLWDQLPICSHQSKL